MNSFSLQIDFYIKDIIQTEVNIQNNRGNLQITNASKRVEEPIPPTV